MEDFYVFIVLKKLLLFLEYFSLFSKNFIVLVVFIGLSIWCSIYILDSVVFFISSFFLWVLDLVMLMVGNVCLLDSLWFSMILELLVFLNFLKIILFMWLLVLISVVVMMVSDLFFLMFWVVLKKCFGCCSVLVLMLLVSILLEDGMMVL